MKLLAPAEVRQAIEDGKIRNALVLLVLAHVLTLWDATQPAITVRDTLIALNGERA